MSKVFILTECGPTIGYGHLSRCLSIKTKFEEKNISTKMFVSEEDSITGKLPDAESFPWLSNLDCLKEFSPRDILLIDSYLIPQKTFDKILSSYNQPVFIDDFIRREYPQGIVIDWTIDAEKKFFRSRNRNTTYLLGLEYCSLRKAFEKKSDKIIHENVSQVLITLGGSDIRQLSGKIAQHLRHAFPLIQLKIVVGAGVRNLAILRDEVQDLKVSVLTDCSSDQMCALMDEADIVVCGGGQTLYEVASRGTAPVTINLIDNQLDDILGFEAKGFAQFVGNWDAPDLLAKIDAKIRELMPTKKRNDLFKIGRSIINGGGASRIVDKILSQHGVR